MRHLLAIEGMTRGAIESILDRAERLSQRSADQPARRSHAGRTLVNLFLEPSTRTRVSFEIAAKRLGVDVVNVSMAASSMVKGESLADTARTIDAMAPDVIVIRHSFSGAAAYLADRVRASVINAGDGQHEHPTQALLDALTLRRAKGAIEGLTVAIIGDIRHSRVARSNMHCLRALGAEVRLFGPATLMPQGIGNLAAISPSIEDALDGADVVMALRIQKERMDEAFLPPMREYGLAFRLDEARLALAKPDAVVMHPGPMNRGVEISDAVADGPRSLITEQVANGVHVRMAVIDAILETRSGVMARPDGREKRRKRASA